MRANNYIEACNTMLRQVCDADDPEQYVAKRKDKLCKDIREMFEKAETILFCGTLPYIAEFAGCLKTKKKVYFVDQAEDEGLYLQCSLINWDDYEVLARKENILAVILSRSGVSFYNRMIKGISPSVPAVFYGGMMLAYPQYFQKNARADYTERGIWDAFVDVLNPESATIYLHLMDALEDEESKEILARALLFRVTFDLGLNEGLRSPYADYLDEDIMQLKGTETIVDLGGYLGDTLLDILDYFEKKQITFSGDYYLFEPVKEICDEAKKISTRSNIHYCNLCAGNENCYAKAGDGNIAGGFSKVSHTLEKLEEEPENLSGDIFQVTRLDDFFQSKSVDYIKMDIEGGERDAILGSKELISRCRPALAICLYHKYEDIRVLYSLVKELGNYKYFIRAQRNSVVTEYMMYAIPNE